MLDKCFDEQTATGFIRLLSKRVNCCQAVIILTFNKPWLHLESIKLHENFCLRFQIIF